MRTSMVRFIFCVLYAVSPVTANVIFLNEGYCDLELFVLDDTHQEQHRVRKGVLFGKRSARFIGNLSATFEIVMHGEVVREIVVPSHQPQGGNIYLLQKEDMLAGAFHEFIVAENELGSECARPPPLQLAHVWTASLVLLSFLCILAGSVLWASAFPSRGEIAGWLAILAIVYPVSFLNVYRMSTTYHSQNVEMAGERTTWNRVHGDAVWGLYDFPHISWVFGGRRWDPHPRLCLLFICFSMFCFGLFLNFVEHFSELVWNYFGTFGKSFWNF